MRAMARANATAFPPNMTALGRGRRAWGTAFGLDKTSLRAGALARLLASPVRCWGTDPNYGFAAQVSVKRGCNATRTIFYGLCGANFTRGTPGARRSRR